MVAQGIAKVIRQRLLAQTQVDWTEDRPVGIALSGGVDSCSILAAMTLNGVKPVVLSYTPDTHESTDFKMARECAGDHGLEFVPVFVSMSTARLESGARDVIAYGYKTKLEVECLVPMMQVLRVAARVGVHALYTGDQADGFFINSNWMARNFDRAQGIPGYKRTAVKVDDDPWRIDRLRDIYWDEDRSCSGALQFMGSNGLGVDVRVPYRDPAIREAFRGSLWRDVNEPRIKEPIRLAFKDVLNVRIPTRPLPVNLHKGDSRFAEVMGQKLMAAEHLKGPWKTTTGLYSAMARGAV